MSGHLSGHMSGQIQPNTPYILKNFFEINWSRRFQKKTVLVDIYKSLKK